MSENEALVRTLFDLIRSGRMDAAWALYTEDATMEAPGTLVGGSYRGKDALREHALRTARALPGRPSFTLANVWAAGSTVVAEIEARTRLPDGREEGWRSAEVFEIRDGKIAAVRLYTDTEKISRLAGRG